MKRIIFRDVTLLSLLGTCCFTIAWLILQPWRQGWLSSSETLEDIYKTTSLHTLAEISDILEEFTVIFTVKAYTEQVSSKQQSKLRKKKLDIGHGMSSEWTKMNKEKNELTVTLIGVLFHPKIEMEA